jgi:hypothetical protein
MQATKNGPGELRNNLNISEALKVKRMRQSYKKTNDYTKRPGFKTLNKHLLSIYTLLLAQESFPIAFSITWVRSYEGCAKAKVMVIACWQRMRYHAFGDADRLQFGLFSAVYHIDTWGGIARFKS